MSSWLARARGGRTLAVLLVAAAFLLAVGAAPASAQADKRVVKVMTYNMDAGTDFLYFFYSNGDFVTAYGQTVAELEASQFEARAGRLADKIAAEKPYLVSLQEVTLWDYVMGTTQVGVLADQLDLLKAALKARKLPYKVVAVQNLTNIGLPVGGGVDFHFLDRNVILARTDLTQAELGLSNVQMGVYEARIELLGMFTQINGWMSVDAKIRGKSLRFFATHLESPQSATDNTQVLQGLELLQLADLSPYPVIFAGDFNSDASGSPYAVDMTPTAQLIVEAGLFVDAWTAAGHNTLTGLTWPMFWEDTNAGVYPDGTPIERIDLIFARDLDVLDAKVVGTTAPYPSDHAGVVATLLIDK